MKPQGRPPKYCVWEKHGMYRTPTHITWKSMILRCRNPKDEHYPLYGGRGIKVCNRWSRFTNFLADMGERPAGMTLDRIDTNGDYNPSNCRWATGKTQRHNSRQAMRYLTVGVVTMCLSEWCKYLGLRENKVRYRLAQGWPVEKALSTQRYNRSGRVVGT